MRRTIKTKVDLPKEDSILLLKTCSQVFNEYINWSFENKSYSKSAAHKSLYNYLRSKYPNLPSALLQTVRDIALESVKSCNKSKRFQIKPTKSETSGIRFDKRCCSLRGNLLSISTLGKRFKTQISIPEYFQEVFDTWEFTGLQLIFNKQKQQFFVCLNFEKENPDTKDGEVLGIDRGLRNIVSCSNGHEVSGKNRNRIKRKRAYQRKQLQTKGTRSAKHRLRCLSQKEKRFSLNENHIIAKELVGLEYQIFILEKLSKMNKKKYGKRFNRKIANWSYYQLEQILKYKAEELGKRVEYVDPRYTSQRCNCCGCIDRDNRHGESFCCKECGHTDDADLNAAKNIRDLWVKFQNPEMAGCSQSPECLPTGRLPSWDMTSLQASPTGS
jgi:IS605 OrfB family transposase